MHFYHKMLSLVKGIPVCTLLFSYILVFSDALGGHYQKPYYREKIREKTSDRFQSSTSPTTDSSSTTTDSSSTTDSSMTTIPTTTPMPPMPTNDTLIDDCIDPDAIISRCECIQSEKNCEAGVEKCWKSRDICSDYRPTLGECVRRGALYVLSGGEICDMKQEHLDESNCKVEKTLLAVNLGGQTVKDSRGIIYQADDSHTDMDNFLSAMGFVSTDMDKKIYSTYVTGLRNESCLQYNFRVTKDGWYEISMKVMEPMLTKRNERMLSVTVESGSNTIVPTILIDPFRRCRGRNRGQELAINLNVAGNGTVAMVNGPYGFSLSKIDKKEMNISFCSGGCTNSNSTSNYFTLSGFSVTRLSKKPDNTNILINLTFESLQQKLKHITKVINDIYGTIFGTIGGGNIF